MHGISGTGKRFAGLTELFKRLKVKLTVTLLVKEIKTDGLKLTWLLSNPVLLYYGGNILYRSLRLIKCLLQ